MPVIGWRKATDARWRRLARWPCALTIVATASTALLGQAESEAGIRLQEVLDISLQAATGIRLASQQTEVSRGDLLRARSLYDGLLTVTSAQSRLDDPTLGPLAFDTTEVTVAWRQRLRSGLTIVPSTFVSRTAVEGSFNDAPNGGGVDLTLSLPLLEDRGGIIGRLDEQAAEQANQADLAALRHERASALLDAADAYWLYLAAQRRVDVFALSEQRANLLVEETGALVEAEERPSADLNQVEANLAIKRIERVTAEQRLHEARRALGVAMALPAAEVLGVPRASDDFPPALPFEVDPPVSERLIAVARGNRADLAASGLRESAAQRALEAAENDLKATLDLSLTGGYRGFDQGNDADTFFGPLFRDVPGLSASLGLRFELPHKNTGARGQVTRSRALLAQQRVLREDLDRRVTSAVRVAALALANSLEQTSYIALAVSASRATVDNEKEKYGLGLATLFDVIQAEDNLTAALLSEIDVRRAHALALASLRFETGTLVVPGDPPMAAHAERLTTPPRP